MKKTSSCHGCGLYRHLCICPSIVPLKSHNQVTFIVNKREINKATNTARIAHRSLLGSQFHVVGHKDSIVDYNEILLPDHQNVVLFPFAGAAVLNVENNEPLNLIIPDGNWKQARKIAKKVVAQTHVPVVQLPIATPGEYKVRHHDDWEKICTIEAVHRALSLLEGEEKFSSLYQTFLLFRDTHLKNRGLT